MNDPHPLPPRTIALIVRGRGGDRQAIEELIGLHQERIARFVVAQTGDHCQYEDLCQTVFVKMVFALPRLRAVERFEPWLFQIARNVCHDHLRARTGWRRLFVPYKAAYETIGAPAATSVRDDEAIVARGMARLPDAQRDLLQLSLDGAKSYEELARLAQTSVPAVKSRLHRARENLKAILLGGELE